MGRPEPNGEPCAEIDQGHQNSPERPADLGPVVPAHGIRSQPCAPIDWEAVAEQGSGR